MRPFIVGAVLALACYTAGYLIAARKWKAHGERTRGRMIETVHSLRAQLDQANAREIEATRERILTDLRNLDADA